AFPLDQSPIPKLSCPYLKLKSDFNFYQKNSLALGRLLSQERFRSMLSIFARCCLLVLLSTVLFPAAFAQRPVQKLLLRGRVVDPNHAGIPGADVWAGGNGLPSSSVVTDRNGAFSMTLGPGEYQVRVVAEGFSETTETV